METLTLTPTVEETVVTTNYNWTEDDIRQYFVLDDKAKAEGKILNETKRLRDSYLESFILLGQGEYFKMAPEGIIALLGIDRGVDVVKLYHLTGKVMARLVKGEKDTAKKVWAAVSKAHKTKGVREGEASKVFKDMAEGSTWNDFCLAIDALCDGATDLTDAPLTKLESLEDDQWNRGADARLERLARKRGLIS